MVIRGSDLSIDMINVKRYFTTHGMALPLAKSYGPNQCRGKGTPVCDTGSVESRFAKTGMVAPSINR